jgi:hypothetical protein
MPLLRVVLIPVSVLLALAGCQSAQDGEMVGQLVMIVPVSSSTVPANVETSTSGSELAFDNPVADLGPVVLVAGDVVVPDVVPGSTVTDGAVPSLVLALDDDIADVPVVEVPVVEVPVVEVPVVAETPVKLVPPQAPSVSPKQAPSATVSVSSSGSPLRRPVTTVATAQPVLTTVPQASTTKKSWAIPTKVTIPVSVFQPNASMVSSVEVIQGLAIPVLDGWVSFPTVNSVMLSPDLDDAIQAKLIAELRQDPTRAFFIPNDELSSPDPAMITVIVRAGTGLSGPDAIERLIGSSVDVDEFTFQNRSDVVWNGIPAARAWLAKGDGTNRYLIAGSSSGGRLAVIQATGKRADLGSVHARLIAEVAPQ